MPKTNHAAGPPPAELGFSMPAEWAKHEATWLAWPHNETDWPGKLDTIRWVYTEIVHRIAPTPRAIPARSRRAGPGRRPGDAGETVRMLVNNAAGEKEARRYLQRSGVDVGRVKFIRYATNRGWTRDSGPVFVKRAVGRRGETAIVHFHFNAWAKYPDWEKDTRIPEVAARMLGKRLFDARCAVGARTSRPPRGRGRPARQIPVPASGGTRPFVLEGGGIDVNGRGTLITTEECYLDSRTQVRNPGLGRAGFEAALRQNLGVTNIWWLGGGVAGDDTHGHVDDICRFVNPTTVVLIKEDNRKDVNWRPLAENWERIGDLRLEDGSRPEVVALPMPGPLFFDGARLPASYANFYIANAAVIVPTFNDPNDRLALGILGELFKDRPVVGIHALDLVLGFGTLHCLTQQQPA